MTSQRQKRDKAPEAGLSEHEPATDGLSGPFFRRADWLAFLVTFLITLGVYALTLAPTVTLEDSGELAVASDYLGVPHPPGYPIWSLITWFFQWAFHWVTYRGHPNPAWSVGFASAFFGALSCALLALLVSRSGRAMLSHMRRTTEVLGQATESLFSFTVATCAGLLLAFSPGIWSQSVIVEVYTLNSFFLSIVLVLLYCWMVRPRQPYFLYVMAFMFGLGLTNHQTLLFIVPVLAMGVMLRDFALFRDFVIAGLALFALIVLPSYVAQQSEASEAANWIWKTGPWRSGENGELLLNPGFWCYSISALVVPIVAYFALPRGKEVCYTLLLVLLGVSFYVYLPIASDQNPPINWGYPRTWQGFIHAITRGQYERISPANVFTAQFVTQVGTYLTDLRRQYTLPIALLGFLPFATWRISLGRRHGSAFLVSMVLWTAAFALIMLEKVLPATASGAGLLVGLYKFLAGGMIALAGFGVALMVYNLLKDILLKVIGVREAAMSERALSAVVLAGIVVLYLAYAVMTLGTLRPATPDGPGPSGTHVMVVLFLVLVPPAAFALVHILVTWKTAMTSEIDEVSQRWTITTLSAFALVSVIMMIFLNPKLDIQTLFIQRVQLIQSHAVYALWLGYGLLFALAWLETLLVGWTRRSRDTREPYRAGEPADAAAHPAPLLPTAFKLIGVTCVALLPLVPVLRNAYDQELLHVVGGAEQNGHDFGWQFGHYQLEGAKAILAELDPEEATLPNPEYPLAMDPDAIFFGGTDPGRFVPTYMIYSAHVREDVFLITQNALADNTYLAVMRDLYGDRIWIPAMQDSTTAFQQYVSDVKAGRIPSGAQVTMKDGRVSVQGVQGVMMINGILTKQIFDHNKHKNTFYCEESYVIPWMYPYMEPHGLILKINKNPLPSLTPEMVKNDHDFWEWYTDRLLSNPKFMRDVVARKTFSKLRGALGGLYAYRRMYDEAAYAFGQARDLYDLSPEANFRLAEINVRQGKYDEAIALTEDFLEKDPGNLQVRGYLNKIKVNRVKEKRRRELEPLLSKGGTVDQALELLQLYRDLGQVSAFDSLGGQLVNNPGLQPAHYARAARLAGTMRRFAVARAFAQRHTERFPTDPDGWINLAAVQISIGRHEEVVASLAKAVELGGNQARRIIAQDPRFENVRKHKAINDLITAPTPAAPQPFKLPF